MFALFPTIVTLIGVVGGVGLLLLPPDTFTRLLPPVSNTQTDFVLTPTLVAAFWTPPLMALGAGFYIYNSDMGRKNHPLFIITYAACLFGCLIWLLF